MSATYVPSAALASTRRLPAAAPWLVLLTSVAFAALIQYIAVQRVSVGAVAVLAVILNAVVITLLSRIVEGARRSRDRLATTLVTTAFGIAMVPLISVSYTTISSGIARFDMEFFTTPMRGVIGEGGGALHAITGTLLITLVATIISVPIGLMTSIYLVEYGRGAVARGITFVVDVMTGIPSIVAGLFAYTLFSMILGPGFRSGLAGAIALSVLMIPVVVRSSEEMLRLVPNELREASYALGVPKWLTIVKVVLPTSIAGIVTGVMLAIARVIGETAPLLLTAGYTASMNWDVTDGRMASLPLFVFQSYRNWGGDVTNYADLDRAWTGALTLIIIVMALNLLARLIARFFSPKTKR